MKAVRYSDLNSKQKEIYNFQKVAAMLADYGFNCIKLADDWQGADFLAYHIDGIQTLRVQLKARATIAKKYEGKNLHVAFPVESQGAWYLVKHDHLVKLVCEHTNWLETKSWLSEGLYSSTTPKKEMLKALEKFKLTTIDQP